MFSSTFQRYENKGIDLIKLMNDKSYYDHVKKMLNFYFYFQQEKLDNFKK